MCALFKNSLLSYFVSRDANICTPVFFAGQRCQVPPDSHREQDPQTGPLLQDQESTCSQLEVVCTQNLCQGNVLPLINPVILLYQASVYAIHPAQFIVLLCKR